MESLLWLIPALPLAGFVVNGGLYLLAARAHQATVARPGGGHDHDHDHDPHADEGHGDHAAHAHGTPGVRVGLPAPVVAVLALIGPVVAFVLSGMALLEVHDGVGALRTYFSWIHTGSVDVGFGLQVDALTAIMLMNVTGIGSLIHLYSYGYMAEDVAFPRFMAYLNLFLAAMLVLVMADSLPLLFVGWEGVGLCSYLLIGFWGHDLVNVDAGRKAFVVNRIGDFAFLIGMFVLFALAGSLDFVDLERALGDVDLEVVLAHGPLAGWTVRSALLLAAGALFVGATGKSAQIPLYVWLPDAMAGPTPVSALIHAATMVTAGIYMVGRLDFLFVQLPEVMLAMALVAATTAVVSGLIAIPQNDIKKVLAYSTVSQLGFMFAGMASTVFVTGLFHVVTHAFFKALLFLGAGAVIHALHGEQDVRRMGGLFKDLKPIALTFLIGSAALAGVPGFAGFFSKDAILGAVLAQAQGPGGAGWGVVFGLLLLTAAVTAFYTTRLVMLTFFGPPADPHRHPHPVHWTMTSVLLVLAILSAAGGIALGSPTGWLEHFTEAGWVHATVDHEALHHAHTPALIGSVVAVVLGIGAGLVFYGAKRDLVESLVAGPLSGLHRFASNKFYVDELYDTIVVQPLKGLAQALFTIVDRRVIDSGIVDGTGKIVLEAGAALRRTQTGALSAATAVMTLGAIVLLGYLQWQVFRG